VTSAIAAAWQTLFLLVPVVHMPFGAIGTLFADLGSTRLGWLLTDHAEQLPATQAHAVLGRVNHAVFAGDTAATAEPPPATHSALTVGGILEAGDAPTASAAPAVGSAQRLAERTAQYGTWLRSGQSESEEPAGSPGPATSAGGAGRIWVGTPLRVARGLDRATIDLRNDLAYDGLLVSDRT
jgi:hypothetical protein